MTVADLGCMPIVEGQAGHITSLEQREDFERAFASQQQRKLGLPGSMMPSKAAAGVHLHA